MSNDPPTDSLTPPRPMPAYPHPTPPIPPSGVSHDAIVVHLSYLVAQVAALAPKVDSLHDSSLRRDNEVRSLRADVRKFSEALDEHSDLHKAHRAHLKTHCDEIADLETAVSHGSNDEPKSWVGKLGAKAVDALVPSLVTIVFFGALAGWTGVRLQWGSPAQPGADVAGKPAAQGDSK